MSLADLLVELEAAKDPKKAGTMEAYMRHQFSFLRIAAPERNALYRKYSPSVEKNKDHRLGFCGHLLGKGAKRIPVCGCQLFESYAILSKGHRFV